MPQTIPLFHVGFPKAGSTTLQRELFPKLAPDAYYGLVPTRADGAELDDATRALPFFTLPAVKSFYDHVFMTDGLHYESDHASSLLNEILTNNGNHRPIFSHERGLGPMFAYPDLAIKAYRLEHLFKDLRVLIIIREQRKILLSQYSDHPFDPLDPLRGRPLSFDAWVRKIEKQRYCRFTDAIEYHRILNLYRSIFGPQNVLMLPLELLRLDHREFSRRIAEFTEFPHDHISSITASMQTKNRGGYTSYTRWRQIRRMLPFGVNVSDHVPRAIVTRVERLLRQHSPATSPISDDLDQHFHEKYGPSNALLSRDIGLDLGELGYSMAHKGIRSEVR